jgi:hypothetical protein
MIAPHHPVGRQNQYRGNIKLGQQIKLVIRSNQGEHRKRTSAVPDLSSSHESQQQTQKETASGMRA